jgi:hypothetical protein
MLPIVDVSDNSMAASGTTKRISINNILACSPSATLASATITGDLTVDTSTLKVDSVNNRVSFGIATPNRNVVVYAAASPVLQICDATTGTTANDGLLITQAGVDTFIENAEIGGMNFRTSAVTRYQIDSTGISTWSVAGTTAMTLNSTGLGVGGSPTGTFPVILVEGGAGTYAKFNSKVGAKTWSTGYRSGTTQFEIQEDGTERFVIANGGNVGIGVTPITSHILSAAGPLAITGTFSGTRTSYITNSSAASIYYTDGGGSGYFTDFGNLIIQPRTSAARSVVIATGSTTPVERAVVKSTGQVRFVPLAADPSGAEAGDVYYNSTSNKLKCYNGTTWNDLF